VQGGLRDLWPHDARFLVASIAPPSQHARRVSDGFQKDGHRIVSLLVVPSERSEPRLSKAYNDSAAIIVAVNGINGHRSPERMHGILVVPDILERIGCEIDDILDFMAEPSFKDEELEEAAQPSVPLSELEDDNEELPHVIVIEQPQRQSPPRELVHEGEDKVFVDIQQDDHDDWAPTHQGDD
jgi:hypothetical protein